MKVDSGCLNPRTVGALRKEGSDDYMLVPCGKCSSCRKYKARIVRERLAIIRPFRRTDKVYLASFSATRDRGEPTRENWSSMQEGWRSHSQWLRRNAGLFDYGKFREISPALGEGSALATQGNRLHQHGLLVTTRRIDYGRAQASAARARDRGHNFGVPDYQLVRLDGFREPRVRAEGRWQPLHAYVTKQLAGYVTKELDEEEAAMGGRRFSFSRGNKQRWLDARGPSEWYFDPRFDPSCTTSWQEPDNFDPAWGALVATMIAGPRAPCSLPWSASV